MFARLSLIASVASAFVLVGCGKTASSAETKDLGNALTLAQVNDLFVSNQLENIPGCDIGRVLFKPARPQFGVNFEEIAISKKNSGYVDFSFTNRHFNNPDGTQLDFAYSAERRPDGSTLLTGQSFINEQGGRLPGGGLTIVRTSFQAAVRGNSIVAIELREEAGQRGFFGLRWRETKLVECRR